jgi:Methyltransferase domain
VSAVETVAIERLPERFGWPEPIVLPERWASVPLERWKIEADAVILRWIFRHFRPTRHLEFGTLMGDGVIRCVEECDATVWTINLAEGELTADGKWAYTELASDAWPSGGAWAERLETPSATWVRADAYGLIGSRYLRAGWGRRVCQIYADSRTWDTSAYPDGFFDTAFIDGGHTPDIVASDTRNAIRLVRAGGLVIWHDFCPVERVTASCSSTQGVVGYINGHFDQLSPHFDRLFWVNPSWLLVGVRGDAKR